MVESGYAVETHTVVTPDNYLLRLHRIPNNTGEVVFLQHGLLSSSADWVVTGRRQAMAYYLADNGYDVWMGNYRGNVYSMSHVDYNLGDVRMAGKYWHFRYSNWPGGFLVR